MIREQFRRGNARGVTTGKLDAMAEKAIADHKAGRTHPRTLECRTVTLTDVIDQIKQQSAILRGAGATSLYIFGSYARGENRPDSDIDVFVDYDPAKRFSLLDLIRIERLVEEQLEVPVDMTTRDSLNPLLRGRIEAEAIRVL